MLVTMTTVSYTHLDHVEAHGTRLLDELETLKLAMQLLRTVLTKYTISGIDGGEY